MAMRVERELLDSLGSRVILYIEWPESTGRRDEFSCRIGLDGAGISKSTLLYGVDPMQALLMAVRHMAGFVERESKAINPRRLLWDLGAAEADFGLLS
jgi:hypothetical protein